MRENPTHPRVDYAWYVKGLVDFERTPNILERAFRVDLSERPPTTARKSFTAFKTVVEQYPKSDYAHDARKRMIYLRNRLADYEVHVAGTTCGAAPMWQRRSVPRAASSSTTVRRPCRKRWRFSSSRTTGMGLKELAEQSRSGLSGQLPGRCARGAGQGAQVVVAVLEEVMPKKPSIAGLG